ncbi:hypothetical protein SAMN05428988_4386 [Chitinophaga sp. YR573]|nr:hypothetical protein SAMN05428988_4386 [Chitinophaga sp. YR573]
MQKIYEGELTICEMVLKRAKSPKGKQAFNLKDFYILNKVHWKISNKLLINFLLTNL